MRHLFNRGYYKPFGESGKAIIHALLTLEPEIYGSFADEEKVELEGLVYVIDRLPKGIEACRLITLSSDEGLRNTDFEVITPSKRRRNCYRIDEEQMFIEVTRGRSEIYDILAHLTFLFVEARKIARRAIDSNGNKTREWLKIEEIVQSSSLREKEKALTYMGTILGRTYGEVAHTYERFQENAGGNSGLFDVIYWLGTLAIEELNGKERKITFSPSLRERIGHHIYGERWADQIKQKLQELGLMDRPLHIISANLHSVMNSLYAKAALGKKTTADLSLEETAMLLSKKGNGHYIDKVADYARKNGMVTLHDNNGTNISVQLFDTEKINMNLLPGELQVDKKTAAANKPVILVMDYAFGEQAYETMDELLKPFKRGGQVSYMNVHSISVMGKAGILGGNKGDIMIPTAHVFEGTSDNYPFANASAKDEFSGNGLNVYEGAMLTVLGTSLQNKDVLRYFKNSSWSAVGLEMEGAHYQKAIQAAAKIRRVISENVVLRYAYYASDNPLMTGHTLASGSLGLIGVRPTYMITTSFLNQIFRQNRIDEKNTKAENELI
ncbi:MAG: hypothetical protein MI784_09015 [Cytophagales bacterium]|nr:hypothetical protein [Cytophagales bacterium]